MKDAQVVTHKLKRRVPFAQQSTEVQSLLLRGVAQQIIMMSYPQLSAVKNLFENMGLKIMTTEQVNALSTHIENEAKTLEEDSKAIELTLQKHTELMGKIKAVMSGKDTTMQQKLINIKDIIAGAPSQQTT